MSRWRLFSRHSLSPCNNTTGRSFLRNCESFAVPWIRSPDHTVGLCAAGCCHNRGSRDKERRFLRGSQRYRSRRTKRRRTHRSRSSEANVAVIHLSRWRLDGFLSHGNAIAAPSSKHFPLLDIYLSDTRHNSLKVRGGKSRDSDTEQAMELTLSASRARSFIRWRLLSVVPFRLV